MRLLIQRVKKAQVTVNDEVVGRIGPGLVVLVGVREGDGESDADKLVTKLIHMRLFADEAGKMNLSLLDVSGALLVVSQFTLYADTRKGNRPSYSAAAKPDDARRVYELFVEKCRATGVRVETGVFQAHMVVEILNDGPVTLSCQSEA